MIKKRFRNLQIFNAGLLFSRSLGILLIGSILSAELRAAELRYIGRAGLYSEEFTQAGSLYQESFFGDAWADRFLVGGSLRFAGENPAGIASWVADASTAQTRRIGLYEGAEFTNSQRLAEQ